MMARPAAEQNTDHARAYLEAITADWAVLSEPVMVELRCLFPDRSPDIQRFSPDASGFDWLIEHAMSMNKTGLNCYVVVNPVRSSAPIRRDGKLSGAMDEDIAAAFFCWADGDDAAAAASIKSFVGPKYTMAVMTGTVPSARPHVYWRLERPCFDLAAWTETQKAIAQTLSTDRSVVNPSRIMRLPGTTNWPTEKKEAKGYVPELTTFRDKYPDERPRVSFERMQQVFRPQPSLSQQAAPSFQIDVGATGGDNDARIAAALAGDHWHDNVRDLVGSLIQKGLTDNLIHAITDGLTTAGYTVEQTRREVQAMIDGARRKGFAPEPSFTPNFDHAPAPTPSDPNPAAKTWLIQTAKAFTADFVSPEYIIDGVIQRGRLYTLTAPTGSGKTAVMLYASTALATGMQFAERDVEPGDVLFLAGENPDDVRARTIATMEFYNINPDACRVHFIAGTFSIRKDLERLHREAAALPNLILVVVDTFAAYFDGDDENSNAQALDFARVVRGLTALPSKPAVIMPAHPVKNATRANLSPKGGSSLLNEVDGNLTLWNEGGLLSLHWQGKFRGAEFDPLSFELTRYESDTLKDRKGRLIPTILAKPVLQLRAMQIATENLSDEEAVLLSIAEEPGLSVRERCTRCRFLLGDGSAHKSKMARVVGKLAEQKLIRKVWRNWELTKDGEKAVELITSGKPVAKDA